ncbi:uncharacterized protein TRUGW13939_06769 [Talaromyces rugulosus]|uniref:Uncharacterized protein n=1 Tax=Talaromyces rugulosus TaxID=121627 RepID=A0A7H8QZX3_TALRU|nr:uncharacterized protein TRUGW13939_06769 [Talaromyces rugulosus]QKX59632.1 hypothetical protein TRUGW13939_06769 [Talaromyces rugulosus]
MGYIAPSLTPWKSGYASFRVYQIDPVTFGVMDYTQYITNVNDLSPQAEPEWIPYYSAKANYGSKLSPPVEDPNFELTPGFWHNVTEAMEKDHSVFYDFWNKRTRGFDLTACTGSCISNEICALRGADIQYSCYKPDSGIFSKRDETKPVPISENHLHGSECDHSEAASLLAKITTRQRLGKSHRD